MSNAVLEWIHQVIGNLVRTCNITQYCIDKDDPWSRISAAAEFEIISTTDRIKVYGPGQLIFGRDMILPIKNTVDWELMRQQNQTQINKYYIRKIETELTIPIELEIKSFLLITLNANMKYYIRTHF